LNNKVIGVLGMHRSGTSAFTGALHQLGVQLGKHLYPPQAGVNEKGFWEHGDIVDTHDDLLLALGSFWDDILPLPANWPEDPAAAPYRRKLIRLVRRDFAKATLWGLKDPRLCRLLPLWFDIFNAVGAAPAFVITVREPHEVAGSLARRNRFSTDKSLCLWLSHVLAAESTTRSYPRAFVRYDALLAEPEKILTNLAKSLAITWPRPVDAAAPGIQAFLSPQLRHHNAAETTPDDATPLAQLAGKVYDNLCDASQNDAAAVRGRFDALSQEWEAHIAGFDPLLLEHLTQVTRERARFEAAMRKVYGSWAWKLTKPVRLTERLLKRSY